MSESIIIRSLTDFKLLESQLKKRWLELEDVPNAFRYKLNVQKQKFLDGKLKFLVQVRVSIRNNQVFHMKNSDLQMFTAPFVDSS